MSLFLPRRLDAFTLLEMMVVLVVSSILFGMAYAALRVVQHQQRVFSDRTATLGQISTWQNVIAADMQTARWVEVAADQFRCFRPGGQVVYSLRDSTLVREQGDATDTLRVPVREATYFWQHKPRTQGPIDEVSFRLMAARDTFYVQATAHYAAQQLISESAQTSFP